jgi:hypothetical protein
MRPRWTTESPLNRIRANRALAMVSGSMAAAPGLPGSYSGNAPTAGRTFADCPSGCVARGPLGDGGRTRSLDEASVASVGSAFGIPHAWPTADQEPDATPAEIDFAPPLAGRGDGGVLLDDQHGITGPRPSVG